MLVLCLKPLMLMLGAKAKLIIFATIVLLGITWLLFVKKEKQPRTVFTKEKFTGLKLRTIKPLALTDSLSLPVKCDNLMYDGADLCLTPYDLVSADFQYYKYRPGGNLDKIKVCGQNSACEDLRKSGDRLLLLMRIQGQSEMEESKSSACICTADGKCADHTMAFPFRYTSQIDDSCYYFMAKPAAVTYLYRYNFYVKKKVDSLDLNKIFQNPSEHLDYILSGRMIVDGDKLIYKSIYSAAGLVIDRSDFKKVELFKTIDSLPLPEFKEVKLNESITQYTRVPEIEAAWRIKPAGDVNVVLCRLDYKDMVSASKDKSCFLDVYDKSMHYLYSYRVPRTGAEFAAYAFDIDLKAKSISVLYDDYQTIKRFNFK